MGSTHARVGAWILLYLFVGIAPTAGLRPRDHSWELGDSGSDVQKARNQTEVEVVEVGEVAEDNVTDVTKSASDKPQNTLSTDNQVYAEKGSELGQPPSREGGVQNEVYPSDTGFMSLPKSSNDDDRHTENQNYVQDVGSPLEDVPERGEHVENAVYSDSPFPERTDVDEPVKHGRESTIKDTTDTDKQPTKGRGTSSERRPDKTQDVPDEDVSLDKGPHDKDDEDDVWTDDDMTNTDKQPMDKGTSSQREPKPKKLPDEREWPHDPDEDDVSHESTDITGSEHLPTSHQPDLSSHKPSTKAKDVSDTVEGSRVQSSSEQQPPPDDEDMSEKRTLDQGVQQEVEGPPSSNDEGVDLDDEDEKPPSGTSTVIKSDVSGGGGGTKSFDLDDEEKPPSGTSTGIKSGISGGGGGTKSFDLDDDEKPPSGTSTVIKSDVSGGGGGGTKSFDLDDEEKPPSGTSTVIKSDVSGGGGGTKSFDLDDEDKPPSGTSTVIKSGVSGGGSTKSFDLDDDEKPPSGTSSDLPEKPVPDLPTNSGGSGKSFDLDDKAPVVQHEGLEKDSSASTEPVSGIGGGFDLDEDDPEAERLKEEGEKETDSFDTDDKAEVEPTASGSQKENFDLDDNLSKAEVAKSVPQEGHCTHEGKNPNHVSFKVVVKNFYGVDLKTSSWNADLVLFYRWTDHRAVEGIEFAGDKASMSLEEAKSKCIWMPELTVTNVAMGNSLTTISQTVFVDKDGGVSVTERDLVGLKSRYDLTHYPFDSQELVVRVASTVLMANDLTLTAEKADDHDAAAKEKVADQLQQQGWTLDDASTRTLIETDGPLVKSRGELKLRIVRDWTSVGNVVFLPEVLVTVLPWSAFFSPLAPPFAMPRVVASLIPLLCMVGFMQKSASVLPHASGWTWLDVYEASCLVLIVMAFILNQLLMYVNHSLGYAPAAEKLQITYRYWYGSLVFVINALTFVCRKFNRMTELGALVAAIFALYIIAALFAAWSAVQQDKAQDGEEEEGEEVSNRVQ